MNKQEPSFEQAMNAAILWCNSWEEGKLSDEVLADRVAELIASKNGSRGFFAISLSIDCPLMDRLPDPIIFQLRQAGEPIVELTVKNLAMSSAMAIHHNLNKDFQHQHDSEKIRSRCIELLKLLETNTVKTHLENLLKATKGIGNQMHFIHRWEYTNEQKEAIAKSIYDVAEH